MADNAAQTKTDPTVEEQIQAKTEELARDIGWVPADEWRKKPEDHKSAEDYIRDSKKVIKSDRQSMKSMENKIDTLNTQIGSIRKEHKEGTLKELNIIKQDLEDQRRNAAVDGDSEAYDKIQEKITKIEEQVDESKVAAATPAGEGEVVKDEIFANWEENNPWYNDDPAMTAFADEIANDIAEETPMARRLEIVNAAVQTRFPDAFEEEQAEAVAGASDAETGGAGGVSGTGKVTYEGLPTQGKAACDSFVDQGLGSKEDWLKSYKEAEEEGSF